MKKKKTKRQEYDGRYELRKLKEKGGKRFIIVEDGVRMAFQENLRYYREKAGYKQAKEFTKILGLRYTTYVSYKNKGREPKFTILCKIADLLHVSTDELLGRENNIEKFSRTIMYRFTKVN